MDEASSSATSRKRAIKRIREKTLIGETLQGAASCNQFDSGDLLAVPIGQRVTITAQETIDRCFVPGELPCSVRAPYGYLNGAVRTGYDEIPEEVIGFSCPNAPTRTALHKRISDISLDRPWCDTIFPSSSGECGSSPDCRECSQRTFPRELATTPLLVDSYFV
jgi:hypothetical protein